MRRGDDLVQQIEWDPPLSGLSLLVLPRTPPQFGEACARRYHRTLLLRELHALLLHPGKQGSGLPFTHRSGRALGRFEALVLQLKAVERGS